MTGPQHWLYPVNPDSGYGMYDHAEPPALIRVTAEHLRAEIEWNPNRTDSWRLSSGYKSMQPGDLVWIYSAGRLQQIIGLATAQRIYPFDDGWTVDLTWRQDATRELQKEPITRTALKQRVQTVRRADETARTVLDDWLQSRTLQPQVFEDGLPDSVELSEEDSRQRILQEVAVRQGQGEFRDQLLRAYDHTCAMTGCAAVPVLEAAHIVPYRGVHTNVVTNGLLLRTDVHTLFDLHLIGVDPNYRIVVSADLRGSEYQDFHGRKLRLPRAKRNQPSKIALKRQLANLLRPVGTQS